MQTIGLDERTRKFINLETKEEATQGDALLKKLNDVGYFDQGRDSVVSSINNLEHKNYAFINVLMASVVSSAATALVMTPFDMVFFKQIARSANVPDKSGFADIAKSVYSSRAGGPTALGIAMGSTFVRYFFFYTGVHCFYNANLM